MKRGISKNYGKLFLEILEIRPLSAIACQFYQNAFDTNKNRFLRLEMPKHVHILFNPIYNKTKVEIIEKFIFGVYAASCIFFPLKHSTGVYIIASYFMTKTLFATTLYPSGKETNIT